MKKTIITGGLIFLALMGILFYVEFGLSTPPAQAAENAPAAVMPPAATTETESEIRAVLERYYAIARTNDRAALKEFSRSITAPEYRLSSELGKMNKADAFRLFDAMKVEFLSADFDDLTVQPLGDTAIAKYRDFSRVRVNGEIAQTPTLFTNVWVRRDGRWQIVAEHYSVLIPPKLLPPSPFAENLAVNLDAQR